MGGFGGPQMGFGAPQMGMMPYGNPQIESEQKKALTLTVLSFLIAPLFGIISLVYYQGSKDAANRGDYATALQKAKSSQTVGYVTLGIVSMVFVVACIAGMAGSM